MITNVLYGDQDEYVQFYKDRVKDGGYPYFCGDDSGQVSILQMENVL